MHTNIEYTGTEAEKQARAMKDIQEWFGSRYAEITRDFKGAIIHENMTEEHFRTLCAFGGIQGYPITVWWQKLQDEIANDQNPEQ